MSTRVLVVVASRFGSTRAIGERIGRVLADIGVVAEVRDAAAGGTAAGFDAVVVGSAVEAGRWRPEAVAFVAANESSLAERPMWLFSSGPLGDRAVRAPQPDPKEVVGYRARLRPRDHRVFGGAYDKATADFGGASLVERTFVRNFMPSGDWRDWDAIDAWAAGIARELGATAPAAGAVPVV